MKIRITQGYGWYENEVGEVFRVIRSDDAGFIADDGEVFVAHPRNAYGRTASVVDISHCEFISEDSVSDSVHSPNHYTNGRFETIEVIEEVTRGYDDGYLGLCVGNAIKYLSRAPFKHDDGGTEDLRKAGVYVQFAIEYLTKEKSD